VSGLALIAATARMPVLDPGVVAHVARGLVDDNDATLRGICQIGAPEDADGRYRRWAFDVLRRSEPSASATLLTALDGTDVTDRLGGIGVPCVVVHGEVDAIVPLEHGRAVADGLPDAELVVLPGVGHVPTMTRPLDVVAALERLGQRVDAHRT
jgi:pimeloyl-ACP methyl ester carboxylesterase